MDEYYDILELPNNASKDDIRKSYLRLALKFHPDRNKDPTSHKRFQNINNAYTALMEMPVKETISLEGCVNFFQTIFPSFQASWIQDLPEEWLEETNITRLEKLLSHPEVKLLLNLFKRNNANIDRRKNADLIQKMDVDIHDVYNKKILKVEIVRYRYNDETVCQEKKILLVPVYFPEVSYKGEGDQLNPFSEPGDVIFFIKPFNNTPFKQCLTNYFKLTLEISLSVIECYVGGRKVIEHISGKMINIKINPYFYKRMDKNYKLHGYGLWNPNIDNYDDLEIKFCFDFKDLKIEQMEVLKATFLEEHIEEQEYLLII
jgi:DnaJ-class molecular chaperone